MLEFSDSGLTLGMFRRYARARSILGCLSMSWTCFSSLARKAVISLRREDNSTSGEMAGEASQAKEVHAPLVERMKQISRKSHKYELRHCNPFFTPSTRYLVSPYFYACKTVREKSCAAQITCDATNPLLRLSNVLLSTASPMVS